MKPPAVASAVLAAVLATAVLTTAGCASHPPFDARGPVRAEALAGTAVDVPLVVTSGVLLVPTWIDGHGPFTFALDTGSTTTIVSPSVAARARLRTEWRAARIVTEAGASSEVVRQAALRELRIGDAEFHRFGVMVQDLSNLLDDAGVTLDGILGAPLLRHHLWTVDLAEGTLRLEEGALPPPDGELVLPLEDDDGLPALRIVVAGRSSLALVDTGQRMAVSLGPSDAAALRARLRVVGSSIGNVLGGRVERDVAQLDGDVEAGPLRLHAPQALLGHTTRLGTNAFRGRVLTFDLANRRLRVSPPSR